MKQKTEASQAVDEPFPPMPLLVAKHAVIGDLFDCFALQQYAMRYADLVVAALKAQPAPTDPVAWMCPNDPDSASAFIWARKGVDYSNMSCDSCGGKHVPVYRQPAPTEAAQGNTSNNSSSSQISGNSGELQPSGNTGELAQGEDSARLDADRYQWVRAADWSDIESIFWSHAVQSGSSPEACQAELDAAIDRARASAETGGVNAQPPYPEGDVVGACVCGSWPGGKCLKCPWIAAPQPQEQP